MIPDYQCATTVYFFIIWQGDAGDSAMPLRFVWGVMPEDNGDHLDPASRGSLKFDPRFDIAAPDSQAWLIKFCHNLK